MVGRCESKAVRVALKAEYLRLSSMNVSDFGAAWGTVVEDRAKFNATVDEFNNTTTCPRFNKRFVIGPQRPSIDPGKMSYKTFTVGEQVE